MEAETKNAAYDSANDAFADARMRIGAERIAVGSKGRMEHIDPARGAPNGSFPIGGAEEADAAVSAAKAAFPAWRDTPPGVRRDIMLRFADIVSARGEEFGAIASREAGHPYNPNTLAKVIDHFTYYAGWADKLDGATLPVFGPSALDYTVCEPYGVVLALTTWNGPVTNAAMKLAPALATGNCVVIKPPELGPFGTIRLVEALLEAGLPEGVVNVVTGGPELGEALVRDPRVGKISFTGGIRIARTILRDAAENCTPVVTELGGKSANIVFADADLDRAAKMAAHMGCVQNAGQGCLFPTRLLVEASVYDEVLERVLDYVRAIKIGDPFEPGVLMGPVISEKACTRILGEIARACDTGDGKLLAGGERLGGALARGYFIPPTVFGDVDNKSPLAQEEVFGPVLSVMRFSTEAEAVAMANDTAYGLAGFVHTRSLDLAHRVAARLEAGYIGVNAFPPMPAAAPFGGFKLSGYGREGGREGLLEFVRTKNVYVALN